MSAVGTKRGSSRQPWGSPLRTGATSTTPSLGALPEATVRSTRITPFGVTYEVVVMVDGPNGATRPVVTTWIVEADGPPRLTSTWVDIP